MQYLYGCLFSPVFHVQLSEHLIDIDSFRTQIFRQLPVSDEPFERKLEETILSSYIAPCVHGRLEIGSFDMWYSEVISLYRYFLTFK